MNSYSLGVLSASITIVLGWSLNQASQWFKNKYDNKKNLKLSLYYLLETYHLFTKADIEEVINLYTNKMLEIVPVTEKDLIHGFLKQHIKQVVNVLIIPDLLAKLENIEKNFNETVKVLATIDPLEAFYLNDIPSLFQNLKKIETAMVEIFKTGNEKFPNSNPQESELFFNRVMEYIESTEHKTAIVDLKNEILKISAKIGLLTKFRMRNELNRMNENAKKFAEKTVSEMISIVQDTMKGVAPSNK